MDFFYSQTFVLFLLSTLLYDLCLCQVVPSARNGINLNSHNRQRPNGLRRFKHVGPVRTAKDDPFSAYSLESNSVYEIKPNSNVNRSSDKEAAVPQAVYGGQTAVTTQAQTAASLSTNNGHSVKSSLITTLFQSTSNLGEIFTLFPTGPTLPTSPLTRIPENVLGATIILNATATTTPNPVTHLTPTANKTFVTTQISAQFRPQTTASVSRSGNNVPNRVKGKPLIMCMPEGIMFFAQTYFEFAGRVYARGKEQNAKCVYELSSTNSINVTFLYSECGIPISAKKGDANYQVEVIMSYERENRVQSYLTHCLSQKLRYATEDLPKRIEEALEELNITPIKIESRAPMPQCQMRVIQEEAEGQRENHKYGPSNGTTVRDAYIGQTLKMEFSLTPASAAFGFLIKNCTVLDKISGERYTILDNKGCSVDINIFAHPHYDTYQDVALVHWHAFRIPDNSMLSFQCDCVVCTDIADDDGQNGCDLIPTPPICPEVVTSAALQNALLFDLSENQIFKRSLHNLDVNTSVCLSDNVGACSTYEEVVDNENGFVITENSKKTTGYCLSPLFFSSILSFSLLLFLIALTVYVYYALRPTMKRCLKTKIDDCDNLSVTSAQRVEQSSSIIVESSFTKS